MVEVTHFSHREMSGYTQGVGLASSHLLNCSSEDSRIGKQTQASYGEGCFGMSRATHFSFSQEIKLNPFMYIQFPLLNMSKTTFLMCWFEE